MLLMRGLIWLEGPTSLCHCGVGANERPAVRDSSYSWICVWDIIDPGIYPYSYLGREKRDRKLIRVMRMEDQHLDQLIGSDILRNMLIIRVESITNEFQALSKIVVDKVVVDSKNRSRLRLLW